MDDLETASGNFAESLNLTPIDHRERAGRLAGLGHTYHQKHRRINITAHFAMAVRHYQESLCHLPSPVTDRWRSGAFLYRLHAEAQNWTEAIEVASKTTSLVFPPYVPGTRKLG